MIMLKAHQVPDYYYYFCFYIVVVVVEIVSLKILLELINIDI